MNVIKEREKKVASILVASYYYMDYSLKHAQNEVDELQFLRHNYCIRPLVEFIFIMKPSKSEQIGQRSLIDLLRSEDFKQFCISEYGKIGLKDMQDYAEQVIRVIKEHDLLPKQTPRKKSLEDNDSR